MTKIGIIGGSIAGCAMGAELMKLGYDITVFEKSGSELKDRGAGIGIPPSAFQSLVDRDLLDKDIPCFEVKYFSRIIKSAGRPDYGRLVWDQPGDIYLFNWGSLYKNLRKRIPDEDYKTGMKAVSLRNEGKKAVIRFENDEEMSFDLVICADGYRSLGRKTIFPLHGLKYATYVLWRGALDENFLDDTSPLEHKIASPGYREGHGVWYFVPGKTGNTTRGSRLINWAIYIRVKPEKLEYFLMDKDGFTAPGSIPPGKMSKHMEQDLKDFAASEFPSFYSKIVKNSNDTFVQAIYDCKVPAYHSGRICLAGDAGSVARPHSASGVMKGLSNATSLADALRKEADIDLALNSWSEEETKSSNQLVDLGVQLGDALVSNIPDWSMMNEQGMKKWFKSIVTVKSEILDQ